MRALILQIFHSNRDGRPIPAGRPISFGAQSQVAGSSSGAVKQSLVDHRRALPAGCTECDVPFQSRQLAGLRNQWNALSPQSKRFVLVRAVVFPETTALGGDWVQNCSCTIDGTNTQDTLAPMHFSSRD